MPKRSPYAAAWTNVILTERIKAYTVLSEQEAFLLEVLKLSTTQLPEAMYTKVSEQLEEVRVQKNSTLVSYVHCLKEVPHG